MKSFHKYALVSVSQKGGTGKSTYSCALLDALRLAGVGIAAYDADGSIGSLSDMHAERDEAGRLRQDQDPLTGVVSYDIRGDSRDTLINSLADDQPHVLHDLAGGSLVELQRIFSDRGSLQNLFRAIGSVGGCMVFCHLVTPDRATVESVALHLDLLDSLGELSQCARHVAVLNRQGAREDAAYPDWFGYTDATGTVRGGRTRARLLRAGGAEMDLPSVDDRLMALLKQLKVPFSRACHDPRLTLIEQQRARIFCEDFAAALTPEVRALMGVA